MVFLVGAIVLLFPTISTYWNQYRSKQLETQYTQDVRKMTNKQYEKVWREARAYNRQHTVNTIVDVFDSKTQEHYMLTHPYDELLNPSGNGMMGSIQIPKIRQNLTIYHGTGTKSLEKGVGHIEGTSLPIGGKGTHAVIAGHRGLSNVKLFTDLDQMKIGDKFFLTIMNKKMAYRVDQIKVVKPDNHEYMEIIPGRDLVTLLTCTPYGVNTHRLLIRGTRTKYVEADKDKEKSKYHFWDTDRVRKALILGVFAALILFILLKVRDKKKKQKKKQLLKQKREESQE